MKKIPKPCMLIILDGWGINPVREGNAFAMADTPCLDRLMNEYPHTSLLCSGEAVGLPAGIMGNSEVGHLNIGAGRIVYQDLLRIDTSINNDEFNQNSAFISVMSEVREKNSALHLMGLVSDGGVHSQLSHLLALLEMSKDQGVKRVYVHAILDGRDTPPDSGADYIALLQNHIASINHGSIATICGRFYAMDRDKRWDRVEKAYRLYIHGEGTREQDPVEAVKKAYDNGETDEFIRPIVITGDDPDDINIVCDDDGIIFFNFRADRAREITSMFTENKFDDIERETRPDLCDFVCMTMYDENFTLPVAYQPVHLDKILGEIISDNGLKQFRLAETEKYAHVTYFFNGGEEKPFPAEERCLVPSPRDISTYDQKPEMSVNLVTEEALSKIESNLYDLVVINLANMDMVGHTGILEAAQKACEAVDRCLEKLVAKVKEQGGVLLITADHGNSEQMIADNGHPHTAHTLNPVPFILVDDTRKNRNLKTGSLKDIAPTILHIMGLNQPEEMTGYSLIE